MNDSDYLIIPKDQVHAGGSVRRETVRTISVDGVQRPWHQGLLPMSNYREYADYVEIDGQYSLVDKEARRIAIRLETEAGNHREHHDWKGYDDVMPITTTKVFLNEMHVGTVNIHTGDLLRHLLSVERFIAELLGLEVFGWWTSADMDAVIGRRVEYKGHVGTVQRLVLDQSCAMVHFPTWPKNDVYWPNGDVKIEWLHLNWWPREESA